VYLVEIGHCAVVVGKVADGLDRSDIPVHGINAFEDDQLRAVPCGLEQLFQMPGIVVPKQALFSSGTPHAFNHRIMIAGVGEDQAVRY
jgi:hypothetical protein